MLNPPLLILSPQPINLNHQQEEQIRILNTLKGAGGGAADDDDDSDGLDPDHPDTCKICMDALVDVSFVRAG